MTKEYAFRAVAGDGVETFLNEMAKEGWILTNIQPVGRRIRDTSEGTEEIVFSFGVTVERETPKETEKT